jgi:hypothetical protein
VEILPETGEGKMKVIGHYAGAAVNDSVVCLDHPLENGGEYFTSQDFPEGFLCDYCGKVIK